MTTKKHPEYSKCNGEIIIEQDAYFKDRLVDFCRSCGYHLSYQNPKIEKGLNKWLKVK